jgi:hypothetical protein
MTEPHFNGGAKLKVFDRNPETFWLLWVTNP